MDSVVDLVDASSSKCGHAVAFCSCLQFQDCFKIIALLSEEDTEHDETEPYITRKVHKTFLTVEKMPLTFFLALVNHNSIPITNSLTHMSVDAFSLQLWRHGLFTSDILQPIDYSAGLMCLPRSQVSQIIRKLFPC